ncbi:hypothetical protein [Amycolatopsis eburnea]|uniref:Uncharacterized protein n=1 Tax=Amycolatopsis eburnea TaxID=2267691 RepID=A0A3R9EWG5_9PSEU|nr:hypothetical protein [Amycolatopsis eburnea]RSD24412.1 hypothetical protein EIY87_03870 [Amycolatopsis eburnea]
MPAQQPIVGRILRMLAYLASRGTFLALGVVALCLLQTSELPWAGPVFVSAQLVIVALVRYASEAYEEWADEWVTWLHTSAPAESIAYHRAYVAWAVKDRTRLLGQAPSAVTA